ncbi:hypothetical protein BJX64DRAFT_289254 [Aspergillus heterothallicus]
MASLRADPYQQAQRHPYHPYSGHSFDPTPKETAFPPQQTPRRRRKPITTNTATTSSSTSSKPNSNRCWTWLLIPSGNMHWAKNRASFSSYRRAPSKVGGTRVLGIGTVELKVRRGPSPDDDRMNMLVLQDVLHMPQARCNGLCLERYRETDHVEVDSVHEENGGGEEVRVFSEGGSGSENDSGSGSGSEGEGDGHGRGHHEHRHGEALWYGEGYHGSSRVVLWGDPHGSEDLDNVQGDVIIPGVDASAEELDTLYTRVKERSLS